MMSSREYQAFMVLYDACKEFVRKCDAGEARSVRSYAEMKAALGLAGRAQKTITVYEELCKCGCGYQDLLRQRGDE